MSEKNLSDGETPIIFEQLLNSFQALDTVMVKLIPSDEMKPLVLYFPGDIQDNENTIELEWKEYCLENTLNLLFSRFNQIRKTNICIVRPSRLVGQSSEYDSLLRPGLGIKNMIEILKSLNEFLLKNYKFSLSIQCPILLVCFSKGSLVLNHFFAELATALELKKKEEVSFILDWQHSHNGIQLPSYEPSFRIARTHTRTEKMESYVDEILSFFDRVSHIHYVDGHRFPTNPRVIETCFNYLASFQETEKTTNQNEKILFIHTTPRQIADRNRKWIHAEYSLFLSHIKQTNLKFKLDPQFEKEPISLENHFKILRTFILEY